MPVLQMTCLRFEDILHRAQSRDVDLGSEAPACTVSGEGRHDGGIWGWSALG